MRLDEEDLVLHATRVTRRRRRLQTNDEERTCDRDDCPTTLSRYNLDNDFCFIHQTRKYRFLVRGTRTT